jgi:regulatory protein
MFKSGVRSVVSRRGPESPPFHSGPPPTLVPGPVTALREVARRAGRYSIEVGGGTVAPLAIETVAEFSLTVGRVLDAATLERLQEARAATACYDHALDALARRARASGELERWLAKRDHPRAAIEHAVERLRALGLLDDEAFARSFARSRGTGRGMGPRRIAAELSRRGVARSVADAALAELEATAAADDPSGLSSAERERARVRDAAERRMRSLASLEPEVARRRLTGWLVRRGYSPGISSAVARELIARV